MILSTQVISNKIHNEDSSSEEYIGNEDLNELKSIMKTNEEKKQSKITETGKKSKKNIATEDSSYNLSKIEFKSQSISSSLKNLSRGEDFIQKDILQVLNEIQDVSIYIFYFNLI